MISIPHDEVREHAGLYVLGALTGSERRAFEAHLATCVECATEVRSLSSVAGALAQLVPQREPSPALRARVLASLGLLPASTAAPVRLEPSTTYGRPSFAPWLAAAASVVLAVALAAYAAVLRNRVGDLEVRLRQTTLRADASERQIADAQRTAAAAQGQVAVLAAPDLVRIDLAGQPAAPQASARAFWSRSRGLVFTASNLPAPSPGRIYQLWVLTAQPAPISAGLLAPDPDGRVTAVFDTPSDLPKPTAMALTIEPQGGVPAPTGDKYLVGLVN